MKIVQVTDTHVRADAELLHWGYRPMASLAAVLDRVGHAHPDADMIIVTGEAAWVVLITNISRCLRQKRAETRSPRLLQATASTPTRLRTTRHLTTQTTPAPTPWSGDCSDAPSQIHRRLGCEPCQGITTTGLR